VVLLEHATLDIEEGPGVAQVVSQRFRHLLEGLEQTRIGGTPSSEERVVVGRPDREELLAVRDGAWSYDELIEQCDKLEAGIQAAAQQSRLPEEPDQQTLDQLCVSIVEEVLHAQT
jgi:hypothetical protein